MSSTNRTNISARDVRQQFIDFFVKRHGHTFVPSAPVVPHDDPTLLFTNAGMNQFKPIFLGLEKRAYTRAVNSQKCIRAGGKHNDLDDVGRSRRHHTFFEMLGNWSFGDYFKRGAIQMAWELLTQVWGLDPSRLHVSCYEGNEAARIPRDTEAAELWKEIAGLPDDHIHYFGKDNFWEMGDTGPCGPCTEIYIDRTTDKSGGEDVNGEDPRVMEIWNNVFIQYESYYDEEGAAILQQWDTTPESERGKLPFKSREEVVNKFRKLRVLPAQHVDTGMGLERICQVLQGKDDNYATDLFTPIFEAMTKLTGKTYKGLFPPTNAPDPVAEAADPQLRNDIAFRVVADHVRCLTFALADGAVPSNEGRGYVLRRILRRAARFGRQQLGLREPFMFGLVPIIVETMGSAFPELKPASARVAALIKDEEVSFGRTLERGIQLFEEAAKAGSVSGEDAFKLHDTYGFPIDLTRIMAEERGMAVDITGYEFLMSRAKEIARTGGKDDDSKIGDLPPDALAQLARQGVKPTDDLPKYSHDDITATVMAIWNGDTFGLSPASANEDEELAIILDRTNFYAEMGGQVGDSGELRDSTGTIFDVATTKIVGGYVLHIGRLRNGPINVGDTVTARVLAGRHRTEKNHTSTHLANWALREVLGGEVQQKGSLVDPEKLRFDFSHRKAMSEQELERVESLVNQRITEKLPVYAETAPQAEALKIHGLRAVFGEKYPPLVRVVSIGVPVQQLLSDPQNPKWQQYSIEFCGGTHLADSSEAGAFAITAEEATSKGIRRIVALTGDSAEEAQQRGTELESAIAAARAAADSELSPVIADLQKRLSAEVLPLRVKRRAQAAVAELQTRQKAWAKTQKSQGGSAAEPTAAAGALLDQAETFGDAKIIVGEIAGASDDQLRSAMDWLKKKTAHHGILLAAVSDEKINFVAAVSEDLIARGLKAGDWVRETAKAAGGGGGGRPQMAQAGGKDPSKLPEAFKVAREFARRSMQS